MADSRGASRRPVCTRTVGRVNGGVAGLNHTPLTARTKGRLLCKARRAVANRTAKRCQLLGLLSAGRPRVLRCLAARRRAWLISGPGGSAPSARDAAGLRAQVQGSGTASVGWRWCGCHSSFHWGTATGACCSTAAARRACKLGRRGGVAAASGQGQGCGARLTATSLTQAGACQSMWRHHPAANVPAAGCGAATRERALPALPTAHMAPPVNHTHTAPCRASQSSPPAGRPCTS